MRNHQPRGLTLLELLIASSMVSIVALGFTAVYGTSQTLLTDTLNASGLNGNMSCVMEHITRNIQAASDVTLTGSPTGPSNSILVTFQNGDEVGYNIDTVGIPGQIRPSITFDPDGSGNRPPVVLAAGIDAGDLKDDRDSPQGSRGDGIVDGLVFKREDTNPDPAITDLSSTVVVILRMVQGTASLELRGTAQMRCRRT